jgi:hypothetical protein
MHGCAWANRGADKIDLLDQLVNEARRFMASRLRTRRLPKRGRELLDRAEAIAWLLF